MKTSDARLVIAGTSDTDFQAEALKDVDGVIRAPRA
jgi:hypothetical protein